jgi:hypothetical protein
MNKKLIVVSSLAAMLLPVAAFAVPILPLPGVGPITIIGIIDAIFSILWPLFAAYAVIMFIYAGFMFLNARGDGGGVADARNAVLWGTVGVGVALLAFSIPFMVKGLLNV